ncbi:MAG TPA: radical SAM protein [Azospirillum sp.]
MQIFGDVDELPPHVPVYVYGTGRGGRIVAGAVRRHDRAQLVGVADTHRRGEFMGMPILAPDELLARRAPRSVILLASQWWRMIATDLEARGVAPECLYNATPFFRRFLNEADDDTLNADPQAIADALAQAAPWGDAVMVPAAAAGLAAGWRPDAPLEVPGAVPARLEPLRFSAYRCFAGEDPQTEDALLRRIGEHLLGLDGGFALYAGSPLLDRLADACPALAERAAAVVDHRADADATWRGRPVTRPEALKAEVATVFLAETRADRRMRMRQRLPHGAGILCPDLLADIAPEVVPTRAWIARTPAIYPTILPELEARPGLDMLLVDLPAANVPSIPLGVAYVRNALERAGVNYQIIDADVVFYHRHHIHRLLDVGGPLFMADGRPFPEDPWHTAESQLWGDTANWPVLVETFAMEIAEVVDLIVRARPKVLGLSVHSLNEWIGREVARRVRRLAPDITILVGGYSCYYPDVARAAFPEADLHVVGEADLIVGPLVARLARGEFPANMPGVLSRHDSADWRFVPGPQADDLEALGAPVYDWVPSLDIYRSFRGDHVNRMTASRGCQWSHCTFCAERFNGRARPAPSVVDEIASFLDQGRSNFMLNESIVGGDRDNLTRLCEEIIRRGLKPRLNGLIRADRRNDADYFAMMAAAGFQNLCFGADAWSRNTLKLQRKGYSTETIGRNLRDAALAGIQVTVNMVLGIPGETEEDIDESIALLLANREHIDAIANLNTLILAHGSVYWNEPEKHGIRFRADKDMLYRTHVRAIPEEYWYSEGPYIDGEVRRSRLVRIVTALSAHGLQFNGPAMRLAEKAAGRDTPTACTAVTELEETTVLLFLNAGRHDAYRAPRRLLGRQPSIV